jgi:predicted nucleotide-binding protein
MTIVAEDRYLFVSYARQDLARVKPVVEAVRREVERRAIPVTVWMDLSNLRPGENWQEAILGALASSVGILFFVSAASLQSGWAHQELEAVVGRTHRLAIPVILDRDVEVPRPLSDRQWIDLSGGMTEVMVSMAASSIADALEVYTDSDVGSPAPLSDEDAPAIAADLAQEVRESSKQSAEPGPLRSVFVVHGHSEAALEKLEEHLRSIGVEPVILSRREESAQSLFQKFMAVASKAEFAVVLLSSDDYGASRRQYDADGVGDRALQFRARQNVILELGFFYGQLGWENVFVLVEEPDRVFPNFERPSDLDGVVFDEMSRPNWRASLTAKLVAAGFEMPGQPSES